MSELNIKTRTIDVYETSDGREFESEFEAQTWQQHIEELKGIIMLDSNFHNTIDVGSAIYVYIDTWTQLEAFTAMQAYEGIESFIPEPGRWYYDDNTYSYLDVDKEVAMLQVIIEALDTARE